MKYCTGVTDWLNCTRCASLCTSSCPLEGSDALQKFSEFITEVHEVEELNSIGNK